MGIKSGAPFALRQYLMPLNWMRSLREEVHLRKRSELPGMLRGGKMERISKGCKRDAPVTEEEN